MFEFWKFLPRFWPKCHHSKYRHNSILIEASPWDQFRGAQEVFSWIWCGPRNGTSPISRKTYLSHRDASNRSPHHYIWVDDFLSKIVAKLVKPQKFWRHRFNYSILHMALYTYFFMLHIQKVSIFRHFYWVSNGTLKLIPYLQGRTEKIFIFYNIYKNSIQNSLTKSETVTITALLRWPLLK